MNDKPQPRGLIPRPPATNTITDFIVIVFACMVVAIFVILTVTAVSLALFTDKDVAPFIAIVTDTMTTIVAALVGYVAGRGARAENGKP